MELNKIIRKIINDKISEIHTCLPAKIEQYDPVKMRAKVTLLAKKELEGNMVNIPPIVEVPVAFLKAGPFVIRQPFEKGDPVLVVFGERAIDKLLITGNPQNPQMKRMHSFDDAIVIGGLQLEQDSDLNAEYTEDLLIENQEANSRIVMKKDGDIEIQSDKIIKIASENAILEGLIQGIALGEDLKEWLDNHTHPGDSGGTTGSPITPSPEPSEKVLIE